MPKAKTVYLIANKAFIPNPYVHGVWIRTSPSVLKARCSNCGAEICMPCSNHERQIRGEVHVARKDAAKGKKLASGEYKIKYLQDWDSFNRVTMPVVNEFKKPS